MQSAGLWLVHNIKAKKKKWLSISFKSLLQIRNIQMKKRKRKKKSEISHTR